MKRTTFKSRGSDGRGTQGPGLQTSAGWPANMWAAFCSSTRGSSAARWPPGPGFSAALSLCKRFLSAWRPLPGRGSSARRLPQCTGRRRCSRREPARRSSAGQALVSPPPPPFPRLSGSVRGTGGLLSVAALLRSHSAPSPDSLCASSAAQAGSCADTGDAAQTLKNVSNHSGSAGRPREGRGRPEEVSPPQPESPGEKLWEESASGSWSKTPPPSGGRLVAFWWPSGGLLVAYPPSHCFTVMLRRPGLGRCRSCRPLRPSLIAEVHVGIDARGCGACGFWRPVWRASRGLFPVGGQRGHEWEGCCRGDCLVLISKFFSEKPDSVS